MKPHMQYGLMLGGVLIALPLIIFGVDADKNQTVQNISSFLNVAITAVFVFMAIREVRHQNSGFLSFGKGFSTGMKVTLIGGVLCAVFSYIYFAFLNPSMITFIRMKQEEEMLKSGMSDEMVEKYAGNMETWTNPGMMAVYSLVGMLLIGLVASLISAAILKKDNPAEQIS